MSYITLEWEEVRMLAREQAYFVKCPCCDMDGLQYWDGETGLGVSNTPSGINPEWLCSGYCDNCEGIGFLFKRR